MNKTELNEIDNNIQDIINEAEDKINVILTPLIDEYIDISHIYIDDFQHKLLELEDK